MDWLENMNRVVEHIEENLTEAIAHGDLARIVGCSVYEFARIWSFMTGMTLGEYIRRRRLSRAVIDIQGGSEKIIDIALKYCYESPATFARAFRDMHGITPTDARKGAFAKAYPPISFALTIKGVSEMEFRIEQMESFTMAGVVQLVENKEPDNSPSVHNVVFAGAVTLAGAPETKINRAHPGWAFITAFDFEPHEGKTKLAMGVSNFDTRDEDNITIPAAKWAIFPYDTAQNAKEQCNETYARILTEWLPSSGFSRDKSIAHMEVFHVGTPTRLAEIWMPIIPKS